MRNAKRVLALMLALVFAFAGLVPAQQVQATANYVTVTKTVNPTSMTTVEEAEVTLKVKAAPPVTVEMPNDVVLIIDKSGSMRPSSNNNYDDKITNAKNAAKTFVDMMDLTIHRVAVVDYDYHNNVDSFDFSTDKTAVKNYIDTIVAQGSTATGHAVTRATEMLANHRPDAQPVIIIMTDGAANVAADGTSSVPAGTQYALDSATTAKNQGIIFYTIALLDNKPGAIDSAPNLLLKQMATTDFHHHYVLGSVGLDVIYQQIVTEIGKGCAYDVTLTDIVSPEFELVPNSADNNIPRPTVSGNTLTWKFNELHDKELTFTYKIRAKAGTVPGTYATSQNSSINYLDYAGARITTAVPSANLAVSYPAPFINSIVENNGQVNGGEVVTINGQYFRPGATVTFGTNAATNVQVVDSTKITATVPAGSQGVVTVKVTNDDGKFGATEYRYWANPTITSVNPNKGPITGGTEVTIQGNYFMQGAKVKFGALEATSVTFVSSTQVKAVTPSVTTPATVDVTVENTDGTKVVVPNGFTYMLPAPTISAVTPNTGLTNGGDSVTIDGTGLMQSSKVYFGNAEAIIESFVDSTKVVVKSPAVATAGAVDVKVVNVDGQSAVKAGGFTYTYAAPTISLISPDNGLTDGGNTVTITGQNFRSGAIVKFGSISATNVQLVSSTEITATVPASTVVGNVTVKVENSDKQFATTTYRYWAQPVIDSYGPKEGPLAGGTRIMFYGKNFMPGVVVKFGDKAGTLITYYSAGQIYISTPEGTTPGAVDIKLENPDGTTVTVPAGFTYLEPPVTGPQITAVSPNSSDTNGGILTYIDGQEFFTTTKVFFGTTEVPIDLYYNENKIRVRVPAAAQAGTVDVRVLNADGKSATLSNGYTYIELPQAPAPTISSVSPNSGIVTGGELVYINGSGFTTNSSVYFGNTLTPIHLFYDATRIRVRAPASATEGPVDIRIVNPDNQSVTASGAYTYNPVPTPPPAALTSISPNTGLLQGGNLVNIYGSNLPQGSTYYIGANAAVLNYYYGDTHVRVYTPAATAEGTVDVSVVTPDGQRVTLTNAYTYYKPVPTITSISPNNGPQSGGNLVYLYGTNFEPNLVLKVDGNVVAVQRYYDAGSLRFYAPSSTKTGPVTVEITNPSTGLSASTTYTYNAPPPVPAPVISGLRTTSGPISGYTWVYFDGANFQPGLVVDFGGIMVSPQYYYNSGCFRIRTPAVTTPGIVNVQVVNPDGQRSNVKTFTYY